MNLNGARATHCEGTKTASPVWTKAPRWGGRSIRLKGFGLVLFAEMMHGPSGRRFLLPMDTTGIESRLRNVDSSFPPVRPSMRIQRPSGHVHHAVIDLYGFDPEPCLFADFRAVACLKHDLCSLDVFVPVVPH